ncbi:polymerase/histidinol phosphatase-like protein isoform X2 [Wolffia australiana]
MFHQSLIPPLSLEVKILALTDHDTMEGVSEASAAARKLGIRLIPGVEISCIFTHSSGAEESVHLLAYYSSYGPSPHEELGKTLSTIREGRYLRARDMLKKLSNLKMPIEWDHLAKIAGDGVAPGRLHVARAMVEASYVGDLKQAFSSYLYDGGPAYSTGSEPPAEEVVKLVCRTGGISALAHPWSLKNSVPVIRSLASSGLHAMEVYRWDGKMTVFGDLADSLGLLKIGGSDYHGRKTQVESDLGSINLPIMAMVGFLRLARPRWFEAIQETIRSFVEDPSITKLERLWGFGDEKYKAKMAMLSPNEAIKLSLNSWLSPEELDSPEIRDLSQKLQSVIIREDA